MDGSGYAQRWSLTFPGPAYYRSTCTSLLTMKKGGKCLTWNNAKQETQFISEDLSCHPARVGIAARIDVPKLDAPFTSLESPFSKKSNQSEVGYTPFSSGQKSHLNPLKSDFRVQRECVKSAFTPVNWLCSTHRILSPQLSFDLNVRHGWVKALNLMVQSHYSLSIPSCGASIRLEFWM